MKLSYKDLVTTLFVLGGGAVVYAKFYEYSWALLGSWRTAVAVLAVAGVGMFAFSSFDFHNFSWLNMMEMVLGVIAIGLAIVGMIVTSSPIFYTLAAILGILYLVDTARHARHSYIGRGTTTYHHAAVH